MIGGEATEDVSHVTTHAYSYAVTSPKLQRRIADTR